MTQPIHLKIDQDDIAILTLNRPEVRNALSREMLETFAEYVHSLQSNEQVRALILTGEGESFCAGGDVVEFHRYQTKADGMQLASMMGAALNNLTQLPFPVIAAIEGIAIGGGAEIALACDLRVMSKTARFGFPQVNLALIPVWGGIGRLVSLVGYALAFRLLATGEMIEGLQALEMGLVSHLVPEGQSFETASELALKLSRLDQDALRALKALLRAHQPSPKNDLLEREQSTFANLWASESHLTATSKLIDRLGST